MSRSINKVTLIGTVGKDPEMRFTPGGSAVASFSVATNETYNDKNTGQKVENTEWHRLVAFGKLAEIIQQYVKKGSKLYLEGKLKTNEWEKDGIKRYSTDIIADQMVMLDSKSQNSSQGAQYGQQQSQHPNQQQQAYHQPQNQQGYPQQLPQQQPQQQGATPPPGYRPPQNQQQGQQYQQQAPQNQFDEDMDIPF